MNFFQGDYLQRLFNIFLDDIAFYMDLNDLKYSLGQELCESSASLAMKLIAEVV